MNFTKYFFLPVLILLGLSLKGQVTFNGSGGGGFGAPVSGSNMVWTHDANTIYVTFTKGGGDFNDHLVIYLSTGVSGRSEIGTQVNDRNDSHRSAISYIEAGANKALYLPPGFEANFAIAINTAFGGLWSIPSSGSIGNNGLTYVNSVNSSLSSNTQASFTFNFSWADIGLNQGDQIDFIAIYGNPYGGSGGLGYYSDEGYGGGLPTGDIEQNNFTFTTYYRYPDDLIGGNAATANSGNWSDDINWTNGNPPLSGDIVTVNNIINLDQDATVESLSIASGKDLTINTGQTLTVNEDFTIKSDATGTGSLIVNGTLSVTGTITSERYMSGSETWRLVSSPVTNQVISDVNNWTPTGTYTGGHGYDFYAYEESSATWLNQKVGANSITSFTPGQGYLVSFEAADQTKTFSGTLNDGNVIISVSKTGTGDYAGANLIGNPYPSGIDWNDADRSLFSDNYAYVYDRVSNVGETYEGYALVDGSVADAFVAPHQGFFVIKSTAGSANFTFTNAMRAHGGTFTKAPANFAGLKLKVSNGSYYDIATININETASFDRDRMDAIKFYSNNANMPNFYTISKDSKQLAINTIPAIEIEEPIILGVTIPANGNYEISLIEQGADFADKVIYLEDLLTGVRHNLTTDGSYNYSASTSDDPNRFLLHFGMVGVGEQEQASTLQAYVVDNRLYVNNSLEQAQLAVYDLQGRLVAEQSLNSGGLQSLPLDLPAGVYIVRLNNASESRSLKINVQ